MLPESAGQRSHALRAVFNGLRYLIRYCVAWRAMPNYLPPWHLVYDQAQRWQRTGCFEALAHDLRAVLRLAAGRNEEPSAVLDSRTLRRTPESGGRVGWDGHKRTRGSKLRLAVDTLGHLLALHVTPAGENDRASGGRAGHGRAGRYRQERYPGLCRPSYTGERPARDAQAHGITLEVVKLPEAKRGFVLLPRRWVVEHSFAWMAR